MSGSVRDNILFGQPLQQARYDAVVDACALRHDLEALPDGDMTVIGDRCDVFAFLFNNHLLHMRHHRSAGAST
mgnify:CR=1 FL=1